MKIDQIRIGQWVQVRSNGSGVVLDIGKFNHTYVQQKRVVRWRGIDIEFNGRWYALDPGLGTRRVVIGGLNGTITTVTAASITQVFEAEEVKREIIQRRVAESIGQAESSRDERKREYQDAQRSLVSALAGPGAAESVRRNPYNNPFLPLAGSDVIKQMILLYLQYKLQRGEEIDGISDIESAIDVLRDSVRGLREVEQQYASTTAAAERTVLSQLESAIDNCSVKVIKTEALTA